MPAFSEPLRFATLRAARSLLLSAGLLAAGPVAAEGVDADGLLACAAVFGHVSSLHGQDGNGAEAQSFLATSGAYAATALTFASRAPDDLASTAAALEARLAEIQAGLAQDSAGHPQGERGVIADWLPYCDAIGPDVTRLLQQREARGW